MNKKVFFVAVLIAGCLSAVGYADKVSGSGYDLYDAINSGGMTLTGSGYTLIDSKGDTIGGVMTGGGYTLIPGILGLVGAGVGSAEVPYGTVQLYISRAGSDIQITWEASKYPTPSIYVLSGDGTGKFTNAYSSKWVNVLAGGALTGAVGVGSFVYKTDGTLYHNDQAGETSTENPEMYYKGLQNGITTSTKDPSSGALCIENALAVGKVDVVVPANGLMLLGVPVQDGMVSKIFPGQLSGANRLNIYPRTGGGLDKLVAESGKLTGTDFNISQTIGFWLENPGSSPITITFAGALPGILEKSLEKLDLTGNPLPFGLKSGDLGGETGDTVYPQVGKGLDKITKTASWKDFTLKLNQGFWFEYAADARKWQIDLSKSTAKIVKY